MLKLNYAYYRNVAEQTSFIKRPHTFMADWWRKSEFRVFFPPAELKTASKQIERENDERWAELCAWWRLSFSFCTAAFTHVYYTSNSIVIQKLWSPLLGEKKLWTVDKTLYIIYWKNCRKLHLKFVWEWNKSCLSNGICGR